MTRLRLAIVTVLGIAALLVPACDGGDKGSSPTPTIGGAAVPRSATPELSEGEVALRYFGHSMFQLFSPDGTSVLMDPHSGLGYRDDRLSLQPTIVITTHNHFDHDKVVEGGPGAKIIRGLTLADDDWIEVDETVGDVAIRSFATFHDDTEGESLGKNSMFLLEAAGLRILHAGDLGHVLTEEQVAAIGPVDVLLIPVGGVFTIGPAQADRAIDQLQPKLVLPMHYRTDLLARFPNKDKLATLDDFLEDKTEVERIEGNTFIMEKDRLPQATTILVLDFQ